MEIDARSYRAGFNPGFLKSKGFSTQSGPHKLNGDDRAAIAKAYYAGCGPKELAEQYSITLPHVIQIARRYDEERYLARRKAREVRAIVEAPAIAMPAPAVTTPEFESERPNTYVVHKFDYTQPTGFKHMRITLPLLSIQRSPS